MLESDSSRVKQSIPTAEHIQSLLAHVLTQEAAALAKLALLLPSNAWQLVLLMEQVQGKVIFSGVGKSGLVAQKIAATASSLGVASFFLNPNDALHGDLGAVQKGDLFIALSKSATGDEFGHILPVLRADGITTALICCKRGGLVEKADLIITLPLDNEACMFNLAPTSSSTIMLAFGDALAVATSTLKKFSMNDYARNHPAGALGRRLLWTVRSLMHPGSSLPLISPKTEFKDLLVTITSRKLGVAIIVNQDQSLMGIVTDGDLRRACELGPSVFSKKALEIATKSPKTVTPDTLAYVALEIMENFNITSLVVVDNDKVMGLIHIHDLIKAGIQN